MEELTPLISELAVTVVVTLLGVLVTTLIGLAREARPALVAYVQARVGVTQARALDEVLGVAVRAARDAKLTGKIADSGETALIYAVRLAAEEAARRNINLDEADLEALTRAAYQREFGWLKDVPEETKPVV
jgi:hypothetical protein